jgi:hypothetical protein
LLVARLHERSPGPTGALPMSFLSDFSVPGDVWITSLGLAVCHVTSPCILYNSIARSGRPNKGSRKAVEGQQTPT